MPSRNPRSIWKLGLDRGDAFAKTMHSRGLEEASTLVRLTAHDGKDGSNSEHHEAIAHSPQPKMLPKVLYISESTAVAATIGELAPLNKLKMHIWSSQRST